MTSDCLFCRIVAGEIPASVVHQTENTLAFRDIGPKAPVHVLVIPKAHHENLAALAAAEPGLAADITATATRVAELEGVADSGWRFLFNTGRNAGQEVFHVHGHVLGGRPLGPMLAR